MFRYKIYDLEITPKDADVVGADGSVVKTFRTERQAKSWIDHEVKLAETHISHAGLTAWYAHDDQWYIGEDCQTVGKVNITTTRERRDDLSGMKKFKVVTTNYLKMTARILWNIDVEIDEKFIEYGSPISAIKKAMTTIASGTIFIYARTKLEQQCRDAGISEWRIMDCLDADNKKHCQNLHILMSD